MAADSKLDQTIGGWLEADAPRQLPDRVLRATFERTRSTRQRGGLRAVLGRPQMPRPIFALGGAAVLAVAAVIALNAYNRPGDSGGQQSPAPSVRVTQEPATATASPTPPGISPGRHVLWDGESVGITVTIPGAGWIGEPGEGIVSKLDNPSPPDGAGMIVFTGDLVVYGDPCEWQSTRPVDPSTNVDDFIAAMSAQARRDATEPVGITVGGFEGRTITLHVPGDANFADCDEGVFGSWGVPGIDPSPFRFHQGPGQIDKLWVLDVGGTLVVLDTGYYEGTPASVVAELDAIAQSMTFE